MASTGISNILRHRSDRPTEWCCIAQTLRSSSCIRRILRSDVLGVLFSLGTRLGAVLGATVRGRWVAVDGLDGVEDHCDRLDRVFHHCEG